MDTTLGTRAAAPGGSLPRSGCDSAYRQASPLLRRRWMATVENSHAERDVGYSSAGNSTEGITR